VSEEERKRLIEEAIGILNILVKYADLIDKDLERHLKELDKLHRRLYEIPEKLSLGASMDVRNARDDLFDFEWELMRLQQHVIPRFKARIRDDIKSLHRWLEG